MGFYWHKVTTRGLHGINKSGPGLKHNRAITVELFNATS
jgi:hypothetical protein